jgi:hypothetical protein
VSISKYLVILATVALVQESGYLDVTTETAQSRRIEPTRMSGVLANSAAGDGAIVREVPRALRLTLSEVEGSEHKRGDTLIYEVKILNSSDNVIKIPWTTNAREIEPAKPGPYQYWMASLALRATDSVGQIEVLEPLVLYGSDTGSTTLELPPGLWVRIRAKSRLALPRFNKIASSDSPGAASIRLAAAWSLSRVSFSEQDGEYHETFVPTGQEISSANTVLIHVVPDNEVGGRVDHP